MSPPSRALRDALGPTTGWRILQRSYGAGHGIDRMTKREFNEATSTDTVTPETVPQLAVVPLAPKALVA